MILEKIHEFGKNSRFWKKFTILEKVHAILEKIHDFRKNSLFSKKFMILEKIQDFGKNSRFWKIMRDSGFL